MSTSPVSSTNGAAAQQPDPTAVVAKNELGKDAFLKLLTAQLANQDPLSPVDNGAFIAQLAQFSSVEQLQGVSSRLDTLLLATAASNQMSTASLVGKDVSFKVSGVDAGANGPPPLQAKLDGRASVTATIQDESGRTVRTLSLGAHDAGSFDLGWDGRDGNGNPVPAGHYSVKLSAKAADGSNVAVEARSSGRVQGVSFEGAGTELVIGTTHVKLSDVVQISQP